MTWLGLAYATGTAAALAFSACGRRQAPEAFRLALAFAAWWLAYEVLRPLVPRETLDAMNAPVDSLFGCMAAMAWFARPTRWSSVLVVTFVGQCGLHIAFKAGQVPHDVRHLYKSMINGVYIVQLLLVSWEGARHVGVSLHDWLLPSPDLRNRSTATRSRRVR